MSWTPAEITVSGLTLIKIMVLFELNWVFSLRKVVAKEQTRVAEFDTYVCPYTDNYIEQTLKAGTIKISNCPGTTLSEGVLKPLDVNKADTLLFTDFSGVNIDDQVVSFKENYEVSSNLLCLDS